MKEELERIKQLGLQSVRKELEDRGFPFTDEFTKGGAFLFRDGKYLCCDSEDTRKVLDMRGAHAVSHWMIDDYLRNNKIISCDNEQLFRTYGFTLGKPCYVANLQVRSLEFTDGVLVVNDGTNFDWETAYIDLPVLFKPTTAQLNKVEAWLDSCLYKKTTRINVSLGETLKEYDLADGQTTVDSIMKDITKLYNELERKD